ncbi:hypothetical protein J3R82DRAFT_9147 [Butyriboletus roseoflavus]|nr:hypothetical protein J3R82DRAFT_9147 [Butyriboletus roseoflavus]
MADLYPSGRHSSDRRSMLSSNENIPSTMGWEPDPSNETLLHSETQDHSPTRGERTLRYLCYGLHVFLVAIHVVLVGMLFTHPEHSFSVSINNTGATIALRIFLHAFYLIYTAVLVLLTQQHALSALMVQRQKLTAVHDISGAWNGIGAAISALWQQTKVTSSPSALVLVFIYLSCISGLHIISSSVIQFEAFNNTVTSIVPSSSAWTSSSVDLSTVNWDVVGPLMVMSPLLPTAKGLSGSTLFDVPLTDDAYTGAVVDATAISAECGLLSNLSVGTWNSTDGLDYVNVNVNGLGEVDFQVQVVVNSVLFMDFTLLETSSCSMCNNYAIYQVTTAIGLGNQTGEVFQVDLEGPPLTLTETGGLFNISFTSHFVACTLNATTTSLYLSMQDGKVTNTESLPNNSKEAEPWTVWSSGNTTELTQMFNIAEATTQEIACQGLQFPAGRVECASISHPDRYVNSVLGIPWVPLRQTIIATPASPITLEKNDMENAIAQTAAALIWLGM